MMITDYRRRFLLAGLLLTLAACSAGEPEEACTLIGCDSGLSVNVQGAAAGTKVEAQAAGGSQQVLTCPTGASCQLFFANLVASEVTLRITSGDRSATQALKPSYTTRRPNGPRCPPTCRQAEAVVQAP